MILTEISQQRIEEICRRHLANATLDNASLAEAMRREVRASVRLRARTLLERVGRLCRPVAEVSKEDLQAVLEQTVLVGDILRGKGGWLAPSPLRLVRAATDTYLVLGTVTNRELQEMFPEGVLADALPRRLSTAAEVIPKLSQYRGRLISLDRWSGFGRMPVAGSQWLERLSARARSNPDVSLSWDRALAYSVLEKRWQNQLAEQQLLLRLKLDGFRTVFGWTPNGGQSVLRLDRSEANRTLYSLHRINGCPIEVLCEATPSEAIVHFPRYLPYEEYKYLLASGKRFSGGGLPIIFSLPLQAWPMCREKIVERLGVVFRSHGKDS